MVNNVVTLIVGAAVIALAAVLAVAVDGTLFSERLTRTIGVAEFAETPSERTVATRRFERYSRARPEYRGNTARGPRCRLSREPLAFCRNRTTVAPRRVSPANRANLANLAYL